MSDTPERELSPHDIWTSDWWSSILSPYYQKLIPMLKKAGSQYDVREFQPLLRDVVEFIDKWEQVPKDKWPKYLQDALANYDPRQQIEWIFMYQDPFLLRPSPTALAVSTELRSALGLTYKLYTPFSW
eukprot:4362819-Amphidinium_carterae.1